MSVPQHSDEQLQRMQPPGRIAYFGAAVAIVAGFTAAYLVARHEVVARYVHIVFLSTHLLVAGGILFLGIVWSMLSEEWRRSAGNKLLVVCLGFIGVVALASWRVVASTDWNVGMVALATCLSGFGFVVSLVTIGVLYPAIKLTRPLEIRTPPPDSIVTPTQSAEDDDASTPEGVADEPSVYQLSDEASRDSNIVRYILENDREPPLDRIYFLTITPQDEWGENGAWHDVPTTMLEAMPAVTSEYRLAHGAFLKANHVIDKETEKEAWMKWVTIRKWHSDTEVEVEQGVWCCPSNGGASTVIYGKQGGTWTFKSLKRSWVS